MPTQPGQVPHESRPILARGSGELKDDVAGVFGDRGPHFQESEPEGMDVHMRLLLLRIDGGVAG